MARGLDFRSFLETGPYDPVEEEAVAGLRPTIPYDILVEDDRPAPTSTGSSASFLADAYRDSLFSSTIDDAAIPTGEGEAAAPQPIPPPTDLAAVAGELSLDPRASTATLDRVRRDFAFRNHPDRVSAAFRGAAELRMRIANALIDEAKAKAVPAKNR
jgi:hypothetical protein